MPSLSVVITARASLARVKTVLDTLGRTPGVDLRIILAGGALLHHYGDTEADVGWPVTHRVYSALAGNTLSTTAAETGLLTSYLSHIFREDAPQLVVTIADRHETIATAIAAAYQHIPLAHIQGGEHTGSIDDKVRYAVSMLADWHFPSTEQAETNLRNLGVRGGIYRFGCPSVDLAATATFDPSFTRTLVVLQHPVTNEAALAATQIEETFEAISCPDLSSHDILWFWPGQDAGSDALAKRLREFREHKDCEAMTFVRHLPAPEFLSMVKSCACLVGNSSVGIRECAFLGTPVVNIGSRQQHRERAGNVRDVPCNRYAIRQAILDQVSHGHYGSSSLYGSGDAGSRIARQLLAVCRDSTPQREQGLSA